LYDACNVHLFLHLASAWKQPSHSPGTSVRVFDFKARHGQLHISIFQFDFGTYKIINQASQLSLYSHEAGQPIYVSTPGHSSDQELVRMPHAFAFGLL
jgi:hypothetical protein